MSFRFFQFVLLGSCLFFSNIAAKAQKIEFTDKKKRSTNFRRIFLPVPSLHSNCGPNHPIDIFLARQRHAGNVAIVRLKDGVMYLNPPIINYGAIPKLSQMSSTDADELWGSQIKRKIKPNGLATYELINDDGVRFQIDLTFSHNKITKYRVRSNFPFHKDQRWIQIRN